MKSEIIKQESTVVEIKLTFSKEELAEQLEKAYKDISQKASIKGFRKGKVPRPMLEKFYPKQAILPEVAEEMLNNAMQETVEEYDLVLLTNPDIKLEKLELGSDFIVNVTFAVEPDFEFPNLADIKLTKNTLTVTDAEVEDQLKWTATQYAKLTPSKEARALAAGDNASIKYTTEIFYDDGTSHKNDKEFTNNIKLADGSVRKEFIDSLVGKKPGDNAEVEITYEQAQANQADKRKIVKTVYHVTVTSLLKEEPRKLDDDFAKEFSGGRVQTLDELKKLFKDQASAEAERTTNLVFENDVLNYLYDTIDVEAPEVLVAQEKKRITQDQELKCQNEKITMEDYLKKINVTKEENDIAIEKDAKRMAKINMIISRFARENNVDIDAADIQERVLETAYNTGMSPKQIQEYLKKNANLLEAFKDEIYVSKARKLMASKVAFTVKEFTRDEFDKFMQAKNAKSNDDKSATKSTKAKTTVKKPKTTTSRKTKASDKNSAEQLSLNFDTEEGEGK